MTNVATIDSLPNELLCKIIEYVANDEQHDLWPLLHVDKRFRLNVLLLYPTFTGPDISRVQRLDPKFLKVLCKIPWRSELSPHYLIRKVHTSKKSIGIILNTLPKHRLLPELCVDYHMYQSTKIQAINRIICVYEMLHKRGLSLSQLKTACVNFTKETIKDWNTSIIDDCPTMRCILKYLEHKKCIFQLSQKDVCVIVETIISSQRGVHGLQNLITSLYNHMRPGHSRNKTMDLILHVVTKNRINDNEKAFYGLMDIFKTILDLKCPIPQKYILRVVRKSPHIGLKILCRSNDENLQSVYQAILPVIPFMKMGPILIHVCSNDYFNARVQIILKHHKQYKSLTSRDVCIALKNIADNGCGVKCNLYQLRNLPLENFNVPEEVALVYKTYMCMVRDSCDECPDMAIQMIHVLKDFNKK